ncbi:MAG: DUF177 domain-containing protein [Clostridia bacterium]|nr:DUF177 domain-containing protein [Clostridia bacterium]
MILDLKSVFISDGASLPVDFELDMHDMDFFGICPIKKPVSVKGKVFNRAGIVTADLSCSVEFTAPCDRCGKETVKHHEVHTQRVLVSRLADRESDEIIEIPNMQLDVTELCTDEVVLNLPMKHLCREDCKGVCATCGKDLNEGKCGCNSVSHDPRLEALAQLLNDN